MCICAQGLPLLLRRGRSCQTQLLGNAPFTVTVRLGFSGDCHTIAGLRSQTPLWDLSDLVLKEVGSNTKLGFCKGARVFSEADMEKPLADLGIVAGVEVTAIHLVSDASLGILEDPSELLRRLAVPADVRTSFADLAPTFEVARRFLAGWDPQFVAVFASPGSDTCPLLLLGFWRSQKAYEAGNVPLTCIELANITSIAPDPQDPTCIVLLCPLYSDELESSSARPTERIELAFADEHAALTWEQRFQKAALYNQ